MASGLVVHLEFGAERHTEVLMHERIRIGTDADCELRFHPEAIPQVDGFLLELLRSNGNYRVGDFDRSVRLTLNGAPLTLSAAIEDGDQVRIPETEFVLQFFPVASRPHLSRIAVRIFMSPPSSKMRPSSRRPRRGATTPKSSCVSSRANSSAKLI